MDEEWKDIFEQRKYILMMHGLVLFQKEHFINGSFQNVKTKIASIFIRSINLTLFDLTMKGWVMC